MDKTSYNQLRTKLEAERDAKLKAAEEEFDAAIGHIDFVWNHLKGGRTPSNEQATSKAKSRRRIRAGGRGALTNAMKEAMQSMDDFSRTDVVQYIESHYPKLGAKARELSIVSNLNRFNDAKQIQVIQKGVRGRPQRYKRTDSFSAAE